MKSITSKYAIINNDTIRLSNEESSISPFREEKLKNVTICFLENGCIEIKGEIILYSFSFEGFFVDDNTDISNYNITKRFNLFKFKKMPYVESGWHKLKETKKISIIKNKYEIINYEDTSS